MALQLYLLSRPGVQESGGLKINGITHCIFNADDANADNVKLTIAESVLQGDGIPIPDGYFTTVELLGPPTLGIMTTASDYILFEGGTQDPTRSIA